MTAHNALGSGEADAGAFELIGMVEALEDAKKFVGVCHIETDAVVTDEKNDFSVVVAATNFNDSLGPHASELESIGQQRGKDLFDKDRVALNSRQRMDSPLNGTAFGFLFEVDTRTRMTTATFRLLTYEASTAYPNNQKIP